MEYTNLRQMLETITDELIAEYRTVLLERSASQTGAIADSMRGTVISDEERHEIQLSLLAYWKWVERGRRPGKRPPMDKIEAWIQRTELANIAASEGITIRQLAFLIARKIGREGTEGKQVFYEVFERRMDEWVRRITSAVKEDVQHEAVLIIRQLIT